MDSNLGDVSSDILTNASEAVWPGNLPHGVCTHLMNSLGNPTGMDGQPCISPIKVPVHEHAQAHAQHNVGPLSPNPAVFEKAKGNTNDILFLPYKKHLQTLTSKNGLHFRGLFIHPKLKRFKSLNKTSEWGSVYVSLWNALLRQTSDASEELLSGREGFSSFSCEQLKLIRASDWLKTQKIMPSSALQNASSCHIFATALASNCRMKHTANHQV